MDTPTVPARTKTGGRQIGTPNRTTQQMRELLSYVFECNLEQLKTDMEALTPHQRVRVLSDFAKYVLPPFSPEGRGYGDPFHEVWIEDDDEPPTPATRTITPITVDAL